ncbi:SnoaL-like domain-containing protein [Permianibacter sp. IMCC34836]|nr:SnoaL-like domain-containing protein [Permianibacter fluminis]
MAASLVLAACGQSTPPAETAPVAEAAKAPAVDPVKVIDDYMAAWNSHNADAAASHFADNVTYLDASVGTPQQGRDAARDNVIKVFMTAVPDCHWVRNGAPIVSADGIAFEWTFSGTNTGAWGPDTPATGKSFSFNGVSFIRLQGDKIAYQGDYYDALNFNKQMGWLQ